MVHGITLTVMAGWQQNDRGRRARYYMDPSDGRMVSGRAVEINGVTYQAAADGHLSQQGQGKQQGDQSSQNSGNNASGQQYRK